jgi:hypothetical protein
VRAVFNKQSDNSSATHWFQRQTPQSAKPETRHHPEFRVGHKLQFGPSQTAIQKRQPAFNVKKRQIECEVKVKNPARNSPFCPKPESMIVPQRLF